MTDFVQLGPDKIPLDQVIQVVKKERITQTDYTNAIQFIRVAREVRDALNSIDVHRDANLEAWKTQEKGEYTGAWSKRLAKFVHKEHHIKLDPRIVSIVAERVSRGLQETSSSLEMILSKAPWEAGTFGEAENSCWWPGRMFGHSRDALLNHPAGGAIRIYDDGNPRARCWFYSLEGSLLIFNAYDTKKKLDILAMARLVSVQFDAEYIKHNDVIVDNTYLNGKAVYSVGKPPITRPVTLDFALRAQNNPTRYLSLDYSEQLEIPGNLTCPLCGDHHADLSAFHGRGCVNCMLACSECGEWVVRYQIHRGKCPNCSGLDSSTFICVHCEEECDRDEATELGHETGEWVCESCYDDYYFRCAHCDEVHHSDDSYYAELADDTVCSSCWSDHYSTCISCSRADRDSDMSDVNGESICSSCAQEQTTSCDRCGDLEWNDDIFQVITDDADNREEWCTACFNDHGHHCEQCGEDYSNDVEHEHEEEEDVEN